MAQPIREAATTQIDIWWNGLFRPRLEGLGDQEYVWEPVSGCWTVRPDAEGKYVYDYDFSQPDPAPFTTIAWRMSHIVMVMLGRTNTYFDQTLTFDSSDCPSTAGRAIAVLDEHWTAWRTGLDTLTDATLMAPMGAGGDESYDFLKLTPSDPLINLVLHVHRELMHHGAEIGVLRDLYRGRQS